MITLSVQTARRLAINAQLLGDPRPASMLGVVEHLGGLQMDPIAAVARSERLILWSRLGHYDVAELERALFERRELFEYWAFILPRSDFPIHREAMRRHARGLAGTPARARFVNEWMAANASFRRHVMGRLRREGPLRSRDIEDRAVVPWPSGGWNEGKNVGRMLEILWDRGEIATVGRDGSERVWDLAERRYPLEEPRLSQREVARRLVEGQLRAKGIARPGELGFGFGGRQPGSERALLGTQTIPLRPLPTSNGILAAMPEEPKEPEVKEPEDSERARFVRFAKKLVNVPKKEIDEKAKEWKRRKA